MAEAHIVWRGSGCRCRLLDATAKPGPRWVVYVRPHVLRPGPMHFVLGGKPGSEKMRRREQGEELLLLGGEPQAWNLDSLVVGCEHGRSPDARELLVRDVERVARLRKRVRRDVLLEPASHAPSPEFMAKAEARHAASEGDDEEPLP